MGVVASVGVEGLFIVATGEQEQPSARIRFICCKRAVVDSSHARIRSGRQTRQTTVRVTHSDSL